MLSVCMEGVSIQAPYYPGPNGLTGQYSTRINKIRPKIAALNTKWTWSKPKKHAHARTPNVFPHVFVWGSCFWFCTPACFLLPLPAACHTQLAHTQLVHTPLTHTQFVHKQLAHTPLVPTQLVQFPHTQLVNTQLAHTQLVHTPLTHAQFQHTQLLHIVHTTRAQPVNTQFAHTQLVYTPLTHTQLPHTCSEISYRIIDVECIKRAKTPHLSLTGEIRMTLRGNHCEVNFLRPCSEEGSDAAQSTVIDQNWFYIATTVQKWNENRIDLPVLGLAGCHWRNMKLVQVRRLASQSVSPDQMGVFVGSGPKWSAATPC